MDVVGRSRRLLVGALAVAAAFTAVGAPAPAPAAEGPRVLMVDNEPDLTRWHYAPAEVTVPAGTTVVWFNKGKHEHTVTADDKSFDSGMKGPGGTYSRAFPRPGKFTYYCAPHPWMKGTVQVVAAAPTPRTAAAADPAATTVTTAAAPATTVTTAAAPASPSGATTPAASPESTTSTTAAPAGGSPDAPIEESDEDAAAPASHSEESGDPLVGTLALVLLPTLGALVLGARLRQSQS
jgi:plastocyanin